MEILLDDEDLPTNQDAMFVLKSPKPPTEPVNDISSLKLKELCIVEWQSSVKKYEWYLLTIYPVSSVAQITNGMGLSTDSKKGYFLFLTICCSLHV